MQNCRVLFVINKKAGTNQHIDFKAIIKYHIAKYDYIQEQYEMSGRNPKKGIEDAIQNFKPTIIASLGGDGTISLIASIIKQTDIALLIIPCGSANGMAKELQMPNDIEACLNLILKGKKTTIDLLQVNNQISVHLADVGLNARIVKRFHLDDGRGLFTYGKHLFYEIFLLRRIRFEINYDGKIKKVKAVSITFANATKYGTGAVINPDGILNDGFFEICIVKPFPKYELFKIAFQMFRNTLKFSSYFEVIKCREAIVTFRKKTILQNDGELMNKVNKISLKCLPDSLHVIIDPKLVHPTLIN